MSEMLVSVLTPSFNQGRWLSNNIDSVAGQHYRHIEHIIMDGGSTDGSQRILSEARPAVQWHSERDRGQSHALNKAFEASRGDIIGWLNSDDAYVDRRAVAEAVRVFQRYPEVGIVYGHALLVNPTNRVLQFLWAPRYCQRIFHLVNGFVQPAAFVRREILTSPFVREDLHFVMDRDLWLRLANRTQMRRIDIVVALDRYQPARKSLMPGLVEERNALQRGQGLNPRSRPFNLLVRGLVGMYRVCGLRQMILLPKGVESAIPLIFDDPLVRSWRQVATRRKHMPMD